jgi:tripartite-type tricarboxylate transporter receptor subunit TctC
LQMELLRMRTGIDVLHVPYKSGPEASQATMSGLTDLGFAREEVAKVRKVTSTLKIALD